MEKTFSIQKNKNQIVFYALKNIDELKKGEIFCRINEDETIDIYPEFEYLDNDYLKSIFSKLSDGCEYDFYKLENKSL